MSSSPFFSRQRRPSQSLLSRTDSLPRLCVFWLAQSLCLFSLSPSWSGSSGVGSRRFIQYAFYQVIAAAVVYIIGNLILGILDLEPTGTISRRSTHGSFPVLFITFLAAIYALLKIPALTNHVFSGTSGGSSAAILERCCMNNDASFQNAKRLYLEQYGDPMVTNTYLKIALVLVSLVAIGLALVDLRTIRTFQNFRPLVIRIDELGRAEAINYHNFEYKPQDAEAKLLPDAVLHALLPT